MDRMKRFAAMAKGSSAVRFRKDEDESLVLFGELYKHEKDKDLNLLEPMYSMEFEAIRGDGRMLKLPSGKRDYFLPEGEKHEYDWLKSPPATPLFPSLDMEANSSQMVFQRELPILQSVKTSRFSRKPEAANTSTTSESPTSSSSKSATPTARPSSSSKKIPISGDPAFSKEENSAYRIDKRSSYTPLTNRQHNAAPATTTNTTETKPTKKTSGKKPAAPGSANAVKKVSNHEFADKPHKNITTGIPRARSKDPSLGVKDVKIDNGMTRRLPCPRATTTVAPKGSTRIGTVAATGKGGRAAEAAAKGGRRMGGEKEQRPKLGSHAKKLG